MNRLLQIALPCVLFLLGLAAGAMWSIERRAKEFATGVEQRQAQEARPKAAAVYNGQRAYPTDEEMLTAVMTAVAEKDELRRAHQLYAQIGRLSPAELAVLFTRALQVEDRKRRNLVLTALLARWAAIDPAGAEAAARPFVARARKKGGGYWRSVEYGVAYAWAQAQPAKSLTEAMASPTALWASWTAGAALDGIAPGDKARQLAALRQTPASRLRAEMAGSAIRELAETDSAAAEAALDLLPDAKKRAEARAQILGKLAGRDPAAALARLAELGPSLAADSEGVRLSVSILRGVAKSDPTAALAALEQLPEGLQGKALGATLVGWAEKDPMAALAWATANGVDVSDTKAVSTEDGRFGNSWSPLISTAFAQDPAKTLAWLKAQPASVDRDTMMNNITWRVTPEQMKEMYAEFTPEGRVGAVGKMVAVLLKEDAGKAEAWVKALPAGPERTPALTNLVSQQVMKNPERVEEIIEQWPVGADRDAALRGVISATSYGDPKRAIDYVRRMNDAVTRELALQGIAWNWSYRDDAAARAWLSSAPEFSEGMRRTLLRQFDER